jgi:eukaryotic-like serine/threonine-protein kinase
VSARTAAGVEPQTTVAMPVDDRGGAQVGRGRVRPTWGFVEGDAIAEGRTVLRRLGGGVRYEVLLVWDDARFAVLVAKVLRPDQREDPAAWRDLRREADALQRLAHPSLVRGFDVVLDGRFPHLLIEHLEGPTLLALLERHGPLPPEQALPLALHVAAALHYLAGEDTVHLDVKPSNVVMGAAPRLIDLSVTRWCAAAARLRRPVGTDAYMAPEQCEPGTVGPPTDVWGLGATLHRAVSGSKPFQGEDRFPQLTQPPVPLGDDLPDGFRELIEAMLAFEPADRPTAAQVVQALEPLVDALPRKLAFARRGTRRRRA